VQTGGPPALCGKSDEERRDRDSQRDGLAGDSFRRARPRAELLTGLPLSREVALDSPSSDGRSLSF